MILRDQKEKRVHHSSWSPPRVARIPQGAFANCRNLLVVEFASSGIKLGSIEPQAFSGCAKLSGIYLPASLSAVKRRAFFPVQKVVFRGAIRNNNNKNGHWSFSIWSMSNYLLGSYPYYWTRRIILIATAWMMSSALDNPMGFSWIANGCHKFTL